MGYKQPMHPIQGWIHPELRELLNQWPCDERWCALILCALANESSYRGWVPNDSSWIVQNAQCPLDIWQRTVRRLEEENSILYSANREWLGVRWILNRIRLSLPPENYVSSPATSENETPPWTINKRLNEHGKGDQ